MAQREVFISNLFDKAKLDKDIYFLFDDFGGHVYGDSMVVDSVSYTVRATRLIDDGELVQISLQKTS